MSEARDKETSKKTDTIIDESIRSNNNGSEENKHEPKIPSSPAVPDRDVKRSRRHSPVAQATKACIPDVSNVDTPLLPILLGAKLPDPKETDVEPDEYLLLLVKALFGVQLKVQPGLELGTEYFKPVTPEQQAAYTMEVLTPARDNNVEALKEIVEKKGPQAVNCVNRFGESLLNLACRRGFTQVAEFLLSKEIDMDVRMKDDFGRTPLHDACWHPTPLLEICGWLIQRDPSLLLVADKRGCTPFQYARANDWATWRQFLFDNRDSLQLLTEPSTLKRFC